MKLFTFRVKQKWMPKQILKWAITKKHQFNKALSIVLMAISIFLCIVIVIQMATATHNWGEWVDNSTCSVTCGLGQKNQTRVCKNQPSSNEEPKCDGPSWQVVICTNGKKCPFWSSWKDDNSTRCSKSCERGVKNQTRECISNEPSYNKQLCYGQSWQIIPCNDFPCLYWGNWKENTNCVPGLKKQYCACFNGSQIVSNEMCSGADQQVSNCTGPPCPRLSEFSKIMVVGGSNTNDMSTVEVIDLISETSKCPLVKNYPIATVGAVGGLFNNTTPLVCGGHVNLCYFYLNKYWVEAPSLTMTRFQAAGLPILNNSEQFIITGNWWTKQSSSEVFDGNSWSLSKVYLPFSLYTHCMVYVNVTTIMIIGGVINDFASSKTLYLNNFQGQWIPGPELSLGRRGPSCGKILNTIDGSETSIIVAGGLDMKENGLTSVEILYKNTGTWGQGPSLPIPIGAATIVNDPWGGVVLVGGSTNPKVMNPNIYQLSNAGLYANWKVLTQKLVMQRYWHTAFLIPDGIIRCN